MPRSLRQRLLHSALLLFVGLASHNTWAAVQLWQASKAQQSFYLFGSIHIGKPSFYPLPEAYLDAFNQSERLIVELDIEELSAEDLQAVTQYAQLPSGQTLQQQLEPQTWFQLKLAASKIGVSIEHLQGYHAWFACLTLMKTKFQQLGFQDDYGVDAHFLRQAKQNNKTIVPLETLSEQLQALAVLGKQDESYLLETIEQLDEIETLLPKMVNYWQQGDDERLFALLSEDPMFSQEDQEVLDQLLYLRNDKWIDKLLKQNEQSFVVVGAAHLYGERGLLEQLRAHGFELKLINP